MTFFSIGVGMIIPVFINTLLYKSVKEKFNSISNFVQEKHTKWKNLNTLVSKKHDSRLMIITVSLYMILKKYYLIFLQYMNNSVKKIDKNSYEVTYCVNNKIYKMIVKQTKGPKPFLKIIDEEDNDITHEIEPYIGPGHDFHKSGELTPKFFARKKIIVHRYNGETHIFEDEESLYLHIET